MKNIGTDPDPKGSGRRKTTLDTHNVGGGEHSMKMIELMVAAVLVIALGGCAAISTAYRHPTTGETIVCELPRPSPA
jgi:hypothetical protein